VPGYYLEVYLAPGGQVEKEVPSVDSSGT